MSNPNLSTVSDDDLRAELERREAIVREEFTRTHRRVKRDCRRCGGRGEINGVNDPCTGWLYDRCPDCSNGTVTVWERIPENELRAEVARAEDAALATYSATVAGYEP